MIPRLEQTPVIQQQYLQFIDRLKQSGFCGDICPDYANRTALATDNSIYQCLPQGVVYPKHVDDLVTLAQLSQLRQFHKVVFAPRGGGTGTNGQSLTDGLVVDTSKYMHHILEINPEQGWVRVECGVVKDQLNAALKPYGLFFAPELSTSNRATIGGMISTDASGQGSCRYGKTRDHVLELTTVLLDGSLMHSHALDEEDLRDKQACPSREGHIYRTVDAIFQQHQAAIEATFPTLNRCLTGYDLAHIRDAQQRLNLNNIITGSEGTLGFVAEAKLAVLPIPKHCALAIISYDSFDTALRDANAILSAKPTSIETIDSLVLGLAQQDNIWETVRDLLPQGASLKGINFVEYTADSQVALQEAMAPLLAQLASRDPTGDSYRLAYDGDVAKIWAMRKKAVGLLGNRQGQARPVAFVEDTAVAPEKLADFIAEFRALLDAHQLEYGMFGHVDAGVLHVRPALDMKDAQQAALVRTITDQVVALTQRYGGLLWGEHGKGMRSEYSPQFFGDLYPQLQRIKQAFDPYNQLNPGKIATPDADTHLLRIDEVSTRGERDKTIHVNHWQAYQEGMFCNGNGACHNWNPDDAMCPSWKGTRLRTHSPKGRASLMREWLTLLSHAGVDTAYPAAPRWYQHSWLWLKKLKHSWNKQRGEYDFSHEVYASMSSCLACKSCTGQCPVRVDIPQLRSQFLALYYSRYLRPAKSYAIASLEWLLPYADRVSKLYNGILKQPWLQRTLARTIGLSDSPLLSAHPVEKQLQAMGIDYATSEAIALLDDDEKSRTVIIVQDAFTRFFESPLLLDSLQLLKQLGCTPLLCPYLANGKPLHVQGFSHAFARTARRTSAELNQLAKTGLPLLGLEPSMTLTYRSEYQKVVNCPPPVQLLQEWLATRLDLFDTVQAPKQTRYQLLMHCTEKTNLAQANTQWQSIFAAIGIELVISPTGCCGMAGTFGHETAHLATSKHIYSLSWQPLVENCPPDTCLMATGFSCRSQVKRFSQQALPSPLQVLCQLTAQPSAIKKIDYNQ